MRAGKYGSTLKTSRERATYFSLTVSFTVSHNRVEYIVKQPNDGCTAFFWRSDEAFGNTALQYLANYVLLPNRGEIESMLTR